MRAGEAFVEKAVGNEARQAVLPEVEGRHRDQRRHEAFERVEPAVVGNMRADLDQPMIDPSLDADRGFLATDARPARARVVEFGPDVERKADVTLGHPGTPTTTPT